MDSKLVRRKFLEFFESKQHQIVDSAPLVNKDDPTLMFTNAGMNQFKDYFLGNKRPQYNRVADTQKCLRVSGKHNDLEEVGLDTYHHTMFEMLGNWSFGDYFKKEAIAWAWELLTEVYGLPKDRLYVSVFGGDEGDKLDVDQEAYDYWKEIIAEDRILYGSKKDNFWEMGDTGPCGPCSEIHIDLRKPEEIEKIPGKDLVNQDHPQVVEIWNLVFMEFNRLASGELKNLPAKHVDTGMGFERLCMAIQNTSSNYDTDVFTPLINFLAEKAGVKYGTDNQTDIAIRVISDHVRAIAFAITDGQLPSNTGAGYVIRRILRRAVRYGFTFLDFKKPFIYELVPILVDQFEEVFPELKAQKDFVMKVIEQEEASFLRTLENGLKKIDSVKSEMASKGEKVIDGKLAFELYDTFGFPLDLTSLIARENSLSVDSEGFDTEMQKQKARSKADAAKETGDWNIVGDQESVEFVGYEHLVAEAKLVKYRTIKQKGKEIFQVVLDRTPFYAESGGQVGDQGYLEGNGEKISVLDTKKENDLIVHFTDKLPSNLEGTYKAVVSEKKRKLTMSNHSATHLLHAALRTVLGEHVEQKGSLVNDKVLRFDFSHFQKMTEDEIAKVEHIVNEKIRENIPLNEKRNVPLEEAKKMGAMALFGEKYGEFVRVITFDQDYSVELCGGTHVTATGNIGFFKIVSESSIAAGVRRIEAITSEAAEKYIDEQFALVNELKELLKNPKDLKAAVHSLVEQKGKLEKDIEKLHAGQAQGIKKELLGKVKEVNGANVIIEKITVPAGDALKNLSFELKNEVENLFMVLAAEVDGKPQIAVVIGDSLLKEKDLNAGAIVRELAKEIKGGGGGQPFFATAGGKDINGLDKVLEKARTII
ncbi:alanine--tRNA ligase [Fulvivirga kasyanovii]|uniref:Alanine--tRNA ligase n=1 Tax=Fulvivirga kasyanovii TaxID=396812 RepID=A0ABW9RUU9_9BACT|nr:alanine--tRNA ligase [Fulvivirga kasyanovii]MTI28004.1 alanine--tRNA ligase [Fulvivirga kasyanovii]